MSRLIRNDKSSRKPTKTEPQSFEPLTSESIVAHLKSCQTIAVNHARDAFKKYMEDLDEAFNKEMDNARSNQQVSEISGIQRLFRRNRSELERYYLGYIAEGFVKFKKKELHTEIGQSNSKGELSLVDNEELEETITISTATQKLDVVFAEPLWALNQRFAILNGGEQVTEASNPTAPIQLCESLRRAMRLIPLTIESKSTAYKVYEQHLGSLVKRVIEDVNEHLKQVGVLPNLKYAPPSKSKQIKNEQATAAPNVEHSAQGEMPSADGAVAIPVPDPNQSSEEYQSSLLYAIRGLQQTLGGRRSAGPIGGRRATDQVADGGPAVAVPSNIAAAPAHLMASASDPDASGQVVVTGEQLMSILQSMQSWAYGVVDGSGVVLPDGSAQGQGVGGLEPVDFQAFFKNFAAQMQDGAKTEEKRGVSESDMHTIDLVGMVFDYMLKDESLPDSIKALLSYLHTPFLKLAFIDPGFFEQPEHPARLLLNSLAEAGARWVGNNGEAQHDMYAKIKNIVDRVLSDFNKDVRIITELLLEFNSLTKNIVRRQELMEKRAKEKAQGEARLRDVKAQVNTEVHHRIDGKELPSAVLLFVLQPWSDYLSFCLLRYGEKAEKWARALALVDDLLWAIEPKTDQEEQAKQSTLSSSLLQSIQAGFETIGYDQTKGKKLIEAVSSLLEMAQQNKKAEPAPAPMRDKLEKIAAEKVGPIEEVETDLSREEEKVVESLKMIEFGTWFEFEGGKRLKVAWRNPRTSHYMLVDQMGKQVAMMSGLDIAREMIAKRAKTIAGSSKPFFERALENIFQKLNAQAEAQSGGEDNNVKR